MYILVEGMCALFELSAVVVDVCKGSEVCNTLSSYYNLRLKAGLDKHPPDLILDGAFSVPGNGRAREPVVCEG